MPAKCSKLKTVNFWCSEYFMLYSMLAVRVPNICVELILFRCFKINGASLSKLSCVGKCFGWNVIQETRHLWMFTFWGEREALGLSKTKLGIYENVCFLKRPLNTWFLLHKVLASVLCLWLANARKQKVCLNNRFRANTVKQEIFACTLISRNSLIL